MLPYSVLQRVLNCPEVRTWPLRGEKRRIPRIPIRRKIILHPVTGQLIGRAHQAWTKDISPAGMGVIAPTEAVIRESVLIRVDAPASRNGGQICDSVDSAVVLLCRVARMRNESQIMLLLGTEFSRLLVPGVLPTPGTTLQDYCWLDLLHETPVDPFMPISIEATPDFPSARM